MPEPRSPLAADYPVGRPSGQEGNPGVCLHEITGFDLVQAACWRGRDSELRALLQRELDVPAPAPGYFSATGGVEILAVAPDRYWCCAPRDDERLTSLAEALDDTLGCITGLGHSHVRLRIEGPASRRLLAQEIALDLDHDAFPSGSAARTQLHRVPVTLLAIEAGSGRFDLFLPHTFAASIWSYLLDLAVPFGYEVAPRRQYQQRPG